jgi:type IV pilus assembly protein PilB
MQHTDTENHQLTHDPEMEGLLTDLRSGRFSLKAAIHNRFVGNTDSAYRKIASLFKMQFIETINETATQELPAGSIAAFDNTGILPVYRRDNVLGIATADPFDLGSILKAEFITGCAIETCLAPATEIERASGLFSKTRSIFEESAVRIAGEYESQMQRDEASMTLEEIRKRTESEPVVKMVNLLFDEAIAQGASDIHIEPSETTAIVRFRIDGMLRQHTEMLRWIYLPVTSRIKILADLDIAEKRLPQDGRIRYSTAGHDFDFRVSTLPTHFGEKTVIRILKHDRSLLMLENLGIGDTGMAQIAELIDRPQGMIFVTGPTGSGKSSTLFACLNRIRSRPINITTIENPIEYKLEGVNQVQINEKAGVTFAAVLRSILRQDPDVILVGEIRDNETARIAIQASQTGHLVLSTLHTNDSISAITRLRDLGIPSFLIASSLLGIVAQRLVRVLCPHCRKEAILTEDIASRWKTLTGIRLPVRIFEAEGCERCSRTGYKGRTGIFEILNINESSRALVAKDLAEAAMRSRARNTGMISMIDNSLEKLENGITSIDEVLRVVSVDDLVTNPESA